MKLILKRDLVLYLWAFFDFLYITRFIWLNVSQGRLPLIDDLRYFNEFYYEQGKYALAIFSLSFLLNVSILFSSMLFLIKWKYSHWLVYFQLPLRLLFLIPSVSLFPWLFKIMSIKALWLFFSAVIVSEIIKVATFCLLRRESK